MYKQEWQDTSPLCCCEYLNNENERSHILGCCCNCEALDESADRLITCNQIPFERVSSVMSTLHDRFRIPWRGGAKQISIDSVLPIFLQPIFAYIAGQNLWCTVVVFVTLQISLWYAYYLFLRTFPQTKFFLIWILTSIVLLLLVFEMSVVPLLEILPEENMVFIGLVVSSLFCMYKVRARAELNHVAHNENREDLLNSGNKASEVVCSVCRKRVPPRTYHCRICQACIVKKDHHCVWLDCCIGDRNQLVFVVALLLSCLALLYGAVLTLTSVCHPFFFLETFLLPDDCSDVYHDFEIALCFVSALYCLLLALLLLILLWHQCWLISFGLSGQEWRSLQGGDRRFMGLWSKRPHSLGFCRNWIAFVTCHK